MEGTHGKTMKMECTNHIIMNGGRFEGLEFMCDGRISTEDGYEYSVHRAILASRSEYFRALFCSRINGQVQCNVFIPGISGATLRIVLRYIYHGILDLKLEDLPPLLVACDYLLMDEILEECQGVASELISPENCVDLLNATLPLTTCEGLKIMDSCYRYVETHFNLVVDRSDVASLSYEALWKLLSHNNLVVDCEETIWKVIVKWVEKNSEERIQHFPALLSLMRSDFCSEDFLYSILDHPYVKANDRFQHYAIICSENVKDLFSKFCASEVYVSQTSRQPQRLLFFVSGMQETYISTDDVIDRWWNVGKQKKFSPNQLMSIGQNVYMFDTSKDDGFEFNLMSKQWFTLPPMNEERYDYAIVKVYGHVYSIGGISVEVMEPSNTVEYLDAEYGYWIRACSMPVATLGAAVALKGLVYCVGFPFREFLEQSLIGQVYNPQTDSWSRFPAPLMYRHNFAMVAYRSSIYVIAGQMDGIGLNAVEKYDVEKEEWTAFKDLPFPYSSPKAVVLEDSLVIYDNHHEDWSRNKKPPLYWDAKREEWMDACKVVAEKPFLCSSCYVEDPEVIWMIREEMRDVVPEAAASTWL